MSLNLNQGTHRPQKISSQQWVNIRLIQKPYKIVDNIFMLTKFELQWYRFKK